MTEIEHSCGESQQWYEDPNDMRGLGMQVMLAFIHTGEDAPMPARDRRFRWMENDYDSLYGSFQLENYVATDGLPAHAPPSVRQELNGYLSDWRASMPFSEAERGLVAETHRELMAAPWERGKTLDRMVRQKEVELVDAGLRKVVKGRDLMQRWWLWRRDMDEFADQGGLDQARTALAALAGRLIPPDKMPEIFYELQGEERPVPYRNSFRSTA